jgi:hypothetical protein
MLSVSLRSPASQNPQPSSHHLSPSITCRVAPCRAVTNSLAPLDGAMGVTSVAGFRQDSNLMGGAPFFPELCPRREAALRALPLQTIP